MNDKTSAVNVGVNSFQYILAWITQEENLQLILLLLSIASTIVILITNLIKLWKLSDNKGHFWSKCKSIFIKCFSWFKKAKKDDKIDSSELEELNDSLQEEIEKENEDEKL